MMLIKAILAITGLTLASGKFHFMSLPGVTRMFNVTDYRLISHLTVKRRHALDVTEVILHHCQVKPLSICS